MHASRVFVHDVFPGYKLHHDNVKKTARAHLRVVCLRAGNLIHDPRRQPTFGVDLRQVYDTAFVRFTFYGNDTVPTRPDFGPLVAVALWNFVPDARLSNSHVGLGCASVEGEVHEIAVFDQWREGKLGVDDAVIIIEYLRDGSESDL